MVVTEDFSFPIITNNNAVQNRTILPPLWSMRIISNSDHALDRKDYELGTRKILRRSFSEVESQVMDMSKEDGRDKTKSKEDEEKMDMLWEGLNDDLLVQAAGNGTMMMSSSSSLSSPSSLVETNGSDCESDLHNYGHNSVSACKDDQYQSTEDDQCNDMKFMGSGGGGVFVHPRKKKNLEMVVKMMKKLFLIRDMAGKKGGKKGYKF